MLMKPLLDRIRPLLTGLILVGQGLAWRQTNTPAQLWIRDDANDVGNEPNNETTDFYISDDIWVRRQADPNYDPSPFAGANPPWTAVSSVHSPYSVDPSLIPAEFFRLRMP
jgi:hypothetical protein